MLLHNKIAVIYGAAGSIGAAVARAFAREGATVFLAGRRDAPVQQLAKEIKATGGTAHAAEVDALDEKSVEQHLQSVVEKAGRLDVAFDAIGLPDAGVVGTPFLELDVEKFSLPIVAHSKAYFLIARGAARRMAPKKSGVILSVSALHSRMGLPLVGGYTAAQAVKESLTRSFSAEFAAHGIRVVGLRPQAMPESSTIREAFEPRAKATGLTWDAFQTMLASRTHPKRLMTLDEMANTAAFVASDMASGLTGTTINLTMGSLDD